MDAALPCSDMAAGVYEIWAKWRHAVVVAL